MHHTIDLTALNGTITLTGPLPLPLPLIGANVAFNGPGADKPTIDGASLYRVFFVRTGTVSVSDLTIANGRARGGDGGSGRYGAAAGEPA